MKKIINLIAGLLCFYNAVCQDSSLGDSSKIDFSYNIDLVNRYVWRGLLLDANPNIQPYASLTLGNFTIGSWGSYGYNHNYAEVDWYMSYAIGNVSLTISDYFVTDESQTVRYFYFNSKYTAHALEGGLNLKISDKFPLSLSAATFFWGNDRDENGDNSYSTYLECSYPFAIKTTDLNFFIGGTTHNGYYSTDANIVNVGLSFSKKLEFTDKFSLPVSGTISVNPNIEDIYFVVKITL
jgi:hypothetical protein